MKFLPSFQLKLPFPSFSKPSFDIHEDVKNLMRKPIKRRSQDKDLPKFWTAKERFIVGAILGGTIILSIFFWYKGNGGRVEINMPSFNNLGFGETVIIEK